MWLRRFFLRRSPPTPVLLPSLERLAELIESVVDLLDQLAVGSAREPALPADHVLFVPSPKGYRLLERVGAPPAPGDLLDVEGDRFRVLRLGPSPLPGDRRRCACLERQEPPKVDRTFDR